MAKFNLCEKKKFFEFFCSPHKIDTFSVWKNLVNVQGSKNQIKKFIKKQKYFDQNNFYINQVTFLTRYDFKYVNVIIL